jgi:acetyl esterase/lipase
LSGRLGGLLGAIAAASAAALLCAPLAAAKQTRFPIFRGVSYGPSPAETATIYGQVRPGATTVVLVHGGGWRLQPLATEEGSEAKSLQVQGFVVFDVNYDQDSATERAFPLETNDIVAATEWAIANAASYGANPANVVLLGGSAGGQLVARAAEQLDAAKPGAVRAVISLSGPMNFSTLVALAQNGTIKDRGYVLSIGQALGCNGDLAACSPGYEDEWSPALNIPASGCPDWLLFSSEVDVVAQAQASEMLTDLQTAGCKATWDVVPTGHGFSFWPTISRRVYAFVAAE